MECDKLLPVAQDVVLPVAQDVVLPVAQDFVSPVAQDFKILRNGRFPRRVSSATGVLNEGFLRNRRMSHPAHRSKQIPPAKYLSRGSVLIKCTRIT